MITVYGSPLCPDCRECNANLDAQGVPYEHVDINQSMRNLKAFLRLRDRLPVFEPAKASGGIGIPAIVCEDGSVTLDWKGWMQAQGLPIVHQEHAPTCRIDGTGC